MAFYAVANGRNIGIFLNWTECNHSVKGYKNAMYKKFATRAEAENFIQSNTENHVEFKPDYYVYTDGANANGARAFTAIDSIGGQVASNIVVTPSVELTITLISGVGTFVGGVRGGTFS